MNYSYLYLLFIYYFNYKRDYYECHDVMEELWLDEQRDRFLQGLLQVAVGLYHFRWNNIAGAILLFEGAVEKLAPYSECKGGINLGKIRSEAEDYLSKLRCYEQQPFEFYDLTIEMMDPELKEMVEYIVK
jgi:predicted metal-dependent hydrolase